MASKQFDWKSYSVPIKLWRVNGVSIRSCGHACDYCWLVANEADKPRWAVSLVPGVRPMPCCLCVSTQDSLRRALAPETEPESELFLCAICQARQRATP